MALAKRAPAPRQGATRKPQRQGINWRAGFRGLWLGCKLLTLVAILGTGTYFGVLAAQSWLDKPVTNVSIHGEFTHVSRQAVADRVYAALGDSFIRLDLAEIQRALSEEPWIDYARVQRRWPDGLDVTVIEHKPIARWNDRDALNHRGEIIQLSGGESEMESLADLPQLSGPDGMEQDIMSRYQTISKLLKAQGMTIQRLTCDDSRSWSLQLQDGVTIAMGRKDMNQRVRRFISIYSAQLQSRWAELQRVDLRYFNGLAVQWREQAQG